MTHIDYKADIKGGDSNECKVSEGVAFEDEGGDLNIPEGGALQGVDNVLESGAFDGDINVPNGGALKDEGGDLDVQEGGAL